MARILKRLCFYNNKINPVSDGFGCSVCLNVPQFTSLEFLLQYFTGLECGHKFCMQCWGDYLTTKIIEEGMGQVLTWLGQSVLTTKHVTLKCSSQCHWIHFKLHVSVTELFSLLFSQTISCPAHSCDILVDDNTVM